MKGNKGQTQVEELENNLSSSYLNRVIHHRLIRGDRARLFKPLEFIKLLRGLYSYLTANKHKPSVLVKKLNQIDLTDAQKSFLLYYLDILFFEDSIRNAIERQVRPDSRMETTLGMNYQIEILAEWAKLQTPVDDLEGYEDYSHRENNYRDSLLSVVRNEYVHRRPGGKDDLAKQVRDMAVRQRLRLAIQDRYDFNRVRQYLDTLPNIETKIAYLIEIRTEYLQVGATSEPRTEGFDRKCELEIKKLKRLIKISKPGKRMALAQDDPVTDEKAAAPQRGLSEKEYLILAAAAAKAIGRRGNKLTDERMGEEMDLACRTALKYRRKYAKAYNTKVRREYEEGLKEYTAERNKT